MNTSNLTNGLLFIIAFALVAHLFLALSSQPLIAETFSLDSAITLDPDQQPSAYVHVVVHE
jgi:hypothetical protein